MSRSRLASALVVVSLAASPAATLAQVPPALTTADVATTTATTLVVRVFLKDGTSLVSHGEATRVADRVVFSMPTSASATDPRLHLVNIPAAKVDWERTARYADSARAARYMLGNADEHYAMLTAEIGQALNDVALTTDPGRRLEVIERTRRILADWSVKHPGYKKAEVQEMLTTLDETIAGLRASIGSKAFDLSFVASADASSTGRETLLPAPTPREAIEQTLLAALVTARSAERVSLLVSVLAALDRDAASLPAAFVTTTRLDTKNAIAAELAVDRSYQSLTRRIMTLAEERSKAADVRGLERLLAQIHADDQALGSKRPEAVESLVASVGTYLDAARRVRLERERLAILAPELRKFEKQLSAPLDRLSRVREALEDIRSLAGSTPLALSAVHAAAKQALELLTPMPPPDELRGVHSLLVSAAQLAESAARIRREAALSGNMTRAWDASSAAAGAMMLTARAQAELRGVLSPQ